jgi:hypothetical protein
MIAVWLHLMGSGLRLIWSEVLVQLHLVGIQKILNAVWSDDDCGLLHITTLIDVGFLNIDRSPAGSEIRSPTRHNFDKLLPQPRPPQGFCLFLDRTPPNP